MRAAPTIIGLALAAAIAAATAPAAAAELYKWTDEKGQVHYTDTPPPEGATFEARELEAAPDTPVEETVAGKAAAAEKAKKAESEGCRQARTNVTVLEQNASVQKDVDNDGKPEVLTPEQHGVELQRARDLVKVLCAPSA